MTRFQARTTWAAYEAQRDLLRAWLAGCPATLGRDRRCSRRWTVLELTRHIAHVPAAAVARDRRRRDDRSAAGAERLHGRAGRPMLRRSPTSPWRPPTDSRRRRCSLLRTRPTLSCCGGTRLPDDLVVRANRGPLRIGDYLATRVNELVVHSGDLSRSLPDLEPVPVDRQALAVSAGC